MSIDVNINEQNIDLSIISGSSVTVNFDTSPDIIITVPTSSISNTFETQTIEVLFPASYVGSFESASYSVTSSFSETARTLLGSVVSSSYAVTASHALNSGGSTQGTGIISSSYTVLGNTGIYSSSFQVFQSSTVVSGGYVSTLQSTGIYSGSSQLPAGIISSSYGALRTTGVYSSSLQLPSGIISSSYSVLSGTGIYSSSFQVFQSSTVLSGSIIKTTMNADNVISGSMQVVTSSFALVAGSLNGFVTSASFALTASRLEGSVASASFAETSSFSLRPVKTCRQTAEATAITFGAFTTCSGMTFDLVSGHSYQFQFNTIFKSAGTGTGVGYKFNAPSTTWSHWRLQVRQAAGGTDSFFEFSMPALTTAMSASATLAANTEYIAFIDGLCKPSADGKLELLLTTEVNNSGVTSSYGTGYLVDCG